MRSLPGLHARVALALLALATMPGLVAAHPLAPALLEVRETGGGRLEIGWKTPALRPLGAAAAPALPARCRALGPPVTTTEGTGLRQRWTVDCGPAPLTGERFGVTGLAEPLMALVRVTLADGRLVEGLLTARAPSLAIAARPTGGAIAWSYFTLGVRHIVTGPDHLLFVFGLVLLAPTVRRLVATVTAFTLGHSVTLSLAALGVPTPPTGPIEVAIAASVLVLAIDLARGPGAATALRRHPWGMAAAFGLLHGLGFASALREAGLPAGAVPLALLCFNTGIEAGQLAFVLLVVSARAAVRRLPVRRSAWLGQASVYAMGSLAAFWCFERAAAWLR